MVRQTTSRKKAHPKYITALIVAQGLAHKAQHRRAVYIVAVALGRFLRRVAACDGAAARRLRGAVGGAGEDGVLGQVEGAFSNFTFVVETMAVSCKDWLKAIAKPSLPPRGVASSETGNLEGSGRVFFLVSLGGRAPHVPRAHMWHTCAGGADEIEVAAAHGFV